MLLVFFMLMMLTTGESLTLVVKCVWNWCGVAWRDAVRRGAVRCGVVWCGAVIQPKTVHPTKRAKST